MDGSMYICEQLRTLVDNVMRLFFDCPKLRYIRARLRYTLRYIQAIDRL